jgi:hypothetical protein
MYCVATTVPCLPGIRALGRQTHQKALAAVILLTGAGNKRPKNGSRCVRSARKEKYMGLWQVKTPFNPKTKIIDFSSYH